MKGSSLNRLHRYAGIVIAPFLVIQTLSGLLLSFGLFRRAGLKLSNRGLPLLSEGWDKLFAKLHFGPGLVDDFYHLFLGAGIIWMAISGWVLYLRGRSLRKKSGSVTGPAEVS